MHSQVYSDGNFWDCLGVGWGMGQDGVSDKMWEVLTFGGVEVYLPIFGPTCADV